MPDLCGIGAISVPWMPCWLAGPTEIVRVIRVIGPRIAALRLQNGSNGQSSYNPFGCISAPSNVPSVSSWPLLRSLFAFTSPTSYGVQRLPLDVPSFLGLSFQISLSMFVKPLTDRIGDHNEINAERGSSPGPYSLPSTRTCVCWHKKIECCSLENDSCRFVPTAAEKF